MPVEVNSLLTTGLDLGGVVRYDRPQSLAESERAQVRKNITVSRSGITGGLQRVADIPSRDALAGVLKQEGVDQAVVFVTDASGDPTVLSGWAVYLCDVTYSPAVFTKIAEASIVPDEDIDFTDLYNKSS